MKNSGGKGLSSGNFIKSEQRDGELLTALMLCPNQENSGDTSLNYEDSGSNEVKHECQHQEHLDAQGNFCM